MVKTAVLSLALASPNTNVGVTASLLSDNPLTAKSEAVTLMSPAQELVAVAPEIEQALSDAKPLEAQAPLDRLFENPAAPAPAVGAYDWLSAGEVKQLGQFKQLQNGKLSDAKHIGKKDWPKLRSLLVARSLKANPRLNPALTAYTPGETLNLMKAPEIAAWHEKAKTFKIPAKYKTVIFVPCAKTKPWVMPYAKKSKLYKAYNEIRELSRAGKIAPVYFVTVSEPLGLVPEDFWNDFPQYDNPGLFKDDSQRSGLLTKDWSKTPFKRKKIIPYDERAYGQAIDGLSGVIADFLKNNQRTGRRFLSFVENPDGGGTHSAMLDQADLKLKALGLKGVDANLRFLKRPAARTSPKSFILEKINSGRPKV